MQVRGAQFVFQAAVLVNKKHISSLYSDFTVNFRLVGDFE